MEKNIASKVTQKRGFTLIELLVVISIIGILSAVIGINYNSTRRVARDTKRKADIENVAAALELFYSQNKYYPCANGSTSDATSFNNLLSEPTFSPYISASIVDPTNKSPYLYRYLTFPNPAPVNLHCTKFRVVAKLENTDKNPTIIPTGSGYDYYQTSGVYNTTDSQGKTTSTYQVIGK